MTRFRNRREAGLAVAARLTPPAPSDDVIVLGLPRGGVPVAFEVARALNAPLDVFVVRKLGAPGQPELAMGAIASGGTLVINDEVVTMLHIPDLVIRETEQRERIELDRRERLYRGDRPPLDLSDRTVILVDDGVATGSTMLAAMAAIRQMAPARIIVAVPVAAATVARTLRASADDLVCVNEVAELEGVSLWYDDFGQTPDIEVRTLLDAAGVSDRSAEHAVRIVSGSVRIDADLTVPADAHGLVIFAHGSGSSRKSLRNRAVAETLQASGHATLLLDLLTADEEQFDQRTRRLRFDIGLLAGRLGAATDWAVNQPNLAPLQIGYFGASTGAAAALQAAASRPDRVSAVVSRGGRPDLASAFLHAVRCPTLLIVGGNDLDVSELNRVALDGLHCRKALEIVPGATHLFEEAGALEQVARLATNWFDTYLTMNKAT